MATELWRKYSEHYDAQRARVCPPRQTLRKHYLTNFQLHKMKKSKMCSVEKQMISDRLEHTSSIPNINQSVAGSFEQQMGNEGRMESQMLQTASPIIKHEVSSETLHNITLPATHDEILNPMMDTLFPSMQCLDAPVYEKVKILFERKSNNFFLDWTSEDLVSVAVAVRPFRPIDRLAYKTYQVSEEGQITMTLAKMYGDFSPWAREFIEKVNLSPQDGGYENWDQFKTDIVPLMRRTQIQQGSVPTVNPYATESFQISVNSDYSMEEVDDKNLQLSTAGPCIVSVTKARGNSTAPSSAIFESGDGQQSLQSRPSTMYLRKRMLPFENPSLHLADDSLELIDTCEERGVEEMRSVLNISPNRLGEKMEIHCPSEQKQELEEETLSRVPAGHASSQLQVRDEHSGPTEDRKTLNNSNGTNVTGNNSLELCAAGRIGAVSMQNARPSSREQQSITNPTTLMDPTLNNSQRQSLKNASCEQPVMGSLVTFERVQRMMWEMRDKIARSCHDDPMSSWHDRLRPHLPLIRDHLGETYTLPPTVPECIADLVLVTLHKEL